MDFSWRAHKKVFVIAAVIALIVALSSSSVYLHGILSGLVRMLHGFDRHHPIWGAVLFIVLAATSVLLRPFSSAPVTLFAVAVWGPFMAPWFLFVGWVAGSSGAYAIGRFAGSPVVEKIAGHASLDHWTMTLRSRVHFPLLLLFRLVIPSETGYVFGILKYPFESYFLLTVLSELPFAFFAAYASAMFIHAQWRLFTLLALAGFTAIAAIYWFFSRELGSRKNASN